MSKSTAGEKNFSSSPKLEFDAEQPLEDIDVWPGDVRSRVGRLVHDIEEAQKHMIPAWKARRWAQKLRFLVDVCTATENKNDLDYEFELVSDDIDSSEPYIAISYCWESSVSDQGPSSGELVQRVLVPCLNNPGSKVVRNIRARPDVLHRSFRFAATRGVRKIWIDQECIEQDDREDKEYGIQSMDLVYRHASTTLILLDCHIDKVKDVVLLQKLLDTDNYMSDEPGHEDAERLRTRIAADRWFTRAWTTQEYLVSEESSLVFLVGFNVPEEGPEKNHPPPDDELPPENTTTPRAKREQKVPGEWQFEFEDVHRIGVGAFWMDERKPWAMISSMFMTMVGVRSWRSRVYRLSEVDISQLDWWENEQKNTAIASKTAEEAKTNYQGSPKIMAPFGGLGNENRFYQHISYSLFAIRHKMGKRVADRLAIIANLCNYQWRLDTMAVEEKNLSFSACLIALALFNGDTSLMFANRFSSIKTDYDSFVRSDVDYVSDDNAVESAKWKLYKNNQIPRWLPAEKLAMECVFQDNYKQIKPKCGRSCIVLSGRLVIEGLLWKISPFHELHCLREEMCTSITAKDFDRTRVHNSCLKLLVQQLLSIDRRDILELIVTPTIMMCSPTEIIERIFELQEWFVGRKNGENHEEGLPFTSYGVSAMEWIFKAIAAGKPLAIGSCKIGEETVLGLFDCDPQQVDTVFTHLDELDYSFACNEGDVPYSSGIEEYQSNSWCVDVRDGEVGEKEVLRAREKLKVADGNPKHEETGECRRRGMNISRKRLHITSSVDSVWSPRVSSDGILTPIPQSKSWKMVPLGEEAAYYFVE